MRSPLRGGHDSTRPLTVQPHAFPGCLRLAEMNRLAASQALSGFWPSLLLWLLASFALGLAAALLAVELNALDQAWRPA
jgi:hypothetical protein